MAFDVHRACARNAYWSASLGWRRRVREICAEVLSIPLADAASPAFAEAVHAFQCAAHRLDRDGIIGPSTWRAVRRRLARPAGRVAPATQGPSPTVGVAQRNGFVFLPDRNEDKNEYKGAWKPAADRFCALQGITNRFEFNPHDEGKKAKRERRKEILDALNATSGGLDVIAYYGHGWRNGLSSADFRLSDIPELSAAIITRTKPSATIITYACTSAIAGGFNEELAKACRRTVIGHTTAGHATWNPFVRVYAPSGVGHFLYEPGDRLWRKWRHALRHTNLWARFPFMSDEEREEAVEAVTP